MLSRATRRRPSAWVSKSASTKISTVSSLAWFDADRRIAEIDLVPATIVSPAEPQAVPMGCRRSRQKASPGCARMIA
jgi:hypothetical protein